MILIADSGSTKTAWRLINKEQITQFSTGGINPNSMSESACLASIQELDGKFDFDDIQEFHFYGAGINTVNIKSWTAVLQKAFVHAQINVANDLVAAAKASYGNNSGLVAILGTGSNVGWFDGNVIAKKSPAMGYILGDEGAGVAIGKAVVKGYFRGRWPQELQDAFARKYAWSYDEFVNELYHSERKAAFLAQFSKWAFQQRKHEAIQQIIIAVYQEFFEMIVEVFNQPPKQLAIVGSVAYYWSDYIKKVAANYQINVIQILENPIAALTLYHQNQ
jgi:glucosamine kinase